MGKSHLQTGLCLLAGAALGYVLATWRDAPSAPSAQAAAAADHATTGAGGELPACCRERSRRAAILAPKAAE